MLADVFGVDDSLIMDRGTDIINSKQSSDALISMLITILGTTNI